MFLFPLLFLFSLVSVYSEMVLNTSKPAWVDLFEEKKEKKRKKKLAMEFDLTFKSIISCWESRKCCVVRLFLSEYIVFTCSSSYSTNPQPSLLPSRKPFLIEPPLVLAADLELKVKAGMKSWAYAFHRELHAYLKKKTTYKKSGQTEYFAWKLKIWFVYSPAAHSVWCKKLVRTFFPSIMLSITRFKNTET